VVEKKGGEDDKVIDADSKIVKDLKAEVKLLSLKQK
jgi:hypothetical protein